MQGHSSEYTIGDKIRFNIDYPSSAGQPSSSHHVNSPNETLVTYLFGSGAAVVTNIAPGDQFAIAALGSDNYRITFPTTATVNNINIGDMINIGSNSGWSSANQGTFRVNAKSDANKTIDIYNPNGQATVFGNPTSHSVQCVADNNDSLDGTFFVLNAPNGDTIKFWYDMNNGGTIEPAIGLTTRSWEINPATK